MKTIWKYDLKITESQSVELPIGAKILTVQTQFENPQLWALINPDQNEVEEAEIEMYGTGHPISNYIGVQRKYLSTIQFDGGNYVFHVFEKINNL